MSNRGTVLKRGNSLIVRSMLAQTKEKNACNQRWSRGHKAKGQGHTKKSVAKDQLFETDPLEAQERNARGQVPKVQCASVL